MRSRASVSPVGMRSARPRNRVSLSPPPFNSKDLALERPVFVGTDWADARSASLPKNADARGAHPYRRRGRAGSASLPKTRTRGSASRPKTWTRGERFPTELSPGSVFGGAMSSMLSVSLFGLELFQIANGAKFRSTQFQAPSRRSLRQCRILAHRQTERKHTSAGCVEIPASNDPD
jgi:hypothetical protein